MSDSCYSRKRMVGDQLSEAKGRGGNIVMRECTTYPRDLRVSHRKAATAQRQPSWRALSGHPARPSPSRVKPCCNCLANSRSCSPVQIKPVPGQLLIGQIGAQAPRQVRHIQQSTNRRADLAARFPDRPMQSHKGQMQADGPRHFSLVPRTARWPVQRNPSASANQAGNALPASTRRM